MEDEIGYHTNPSEEMDSPNDPTCSLQKLLRRKTKEEPKKLYKVLLKLMQDVKAEMQSFLPELKGNNIKEESHSSKVQTTLFDKTQFNKFLKEKENDILKTVKSKACNVSQRPLMDKTRDSDIQNT